MRGYRTGTNNSGAVIRVNVDGVTALTINQTASSVVQGFSFEAYVTIMTTGASGTAWTQGNFIYGAAVLSANNTATTTVSTTSDSLIELTLQSGNAANTYYVTNATIEMMK
jgi:hypothetical protein